MFALNGEIPCFVCLFLVECQPSRDDFQLLARKRPCQKFSIDRYSRLIIAIIHMDMGFVMLSDIPEQHINDHATETAQFRHNDSLSFIKRPIVTYYHSIKFLIVLYANEPVFSSEWIKGKYSVVMDTITTEDEVAVTISLGGLRLRVRRS